MEQLIQLRSKKQPQEPVEISPPEKVPSSFWIYRMKIKVILLSFRYLLKEPHASAKIGRFVRHFLTPDDYRANMKKYQQGECNRCGSCCRIIFHCPFLQNLPDGTGHCTIYMTKHAPKACVIFPLDPGDLAEIKRAIAPNTCTFDYAPEAGDSMSVMQMISHRVRNLFKSNH